MRQCFSTLNIGTCFSEYGNSVQVFVFIYEVFFFEVQYFRGQQCRWNVVDFLLQIFLRRQIWFVGLGGEVIFVRIFWQFIVVLIFLGDRGGLEVVDILVIFVIVFKRFQSGMIISQFLLIFFVNWYFYFSCGCDFYIVFDFFFKGGVDVGLVSVFRVLGFCVWLFCIFSFLEVFFFFVIRERCQVILWVWLRNSIFFFWMSQFCVFFEVINDFDFYW